MTLSLDVEMSNDLLAEANLADLYRAFAIPGFMQAAVKPFLYRPAKRLALRMLVFDQEIAQLGLQKAAARFVSAYTLQVRFQGQDFLPKGRLIVAMNHPGLTDILALLSYLGREDLRIVAAERRLLKAMPNLSQYLITLNGASQLRLSTIREVKQHLENEGCLILFPKGAIEPDPLIDSEGAKKSIEAWLPSLMTFASLSRQVAMQAVIVKGVRHPKSYSHPLVSLRKNQKERDWLAATLQLLLRRYQGQAIDLEVAEPVRQPEEVVLKAKKIIG